MVLENAGNAEGQRCPAKYSGNYSVSEDGCSVAQPGEKRANQVGWPRRDEWLLDIPYHTPRGGGRFGRALAGDREFGSRLSQSNDS